MATSGAKSNGNREQSKNQFKGFFNPHVGSEIKSSVKALSLDANATFIRLADLVQAGFKFSMVSDVAATHYTFSLFDKRIESDSQGYVLSVKHSDVAVGVGLLHQLVFEVYEGKGWQEWIEGKGEYDW